MRYWTIYIFGLLFLATSCGQVDEKTTNTPQTDTSTIHAISSSADSLRASLHLTNRNILGNWTNCATMSGGVVATANVCRTIEFRRDNTAIITYPSKEKQELKYYGLKIHRLRNWLKPSESAVNSIGKIKLKFIQIIPE